MALSDQLLISAAPNLQQSVPSPVLSIDDILAGSALVLFASLGIFLHIVEILAMCKLVKSVIGFRFFLALSIADLGMLLLFGIIPGAIIFVPSLLPLMTTAWKRTMHIVADTVWFAGCYMNVLIGITRFACVVFPLHFRMLHQRLSACWLISVAVWAVALAQSWATNSAQWFVVLWYGTGTYGMSADWVAYAESGTRTYYLTLNGLIIVAYLCIYTATAVIIFTKKPVRFRFFNAILKPKCSVNDDHRSPAVDQNNNDQTAHNMGQLSEPRRPSGVVELYAKNAREALQRRSYSNNNVLIRTVNIVRSVVRTNAEPSHSMELRLVIPCCVNALIFIVGQLCIMNGGVGPQGKWADLSIMLIFCLQSIAPPILRLIFSEVLRRQFLALLKLKKQQTNNGTPSVCAVVQQQQKKCVEAAPKDQQKH